MIDYTNLHEICRNKFSGQNPIKDITIDIFYIWVFAE